MPAPDPPTKEKPTQPAVASQIGKHPEKEEACALERSPPARSVAHSTVYPSYGLLTCEQDAPAVELGVAADEVEAAVVETAAEVVLVVAGAEEEEEEDEAGFTATSTLDAVTWSTKLLLK